MQKTGIKTNKESGETILHLSKKDTPILEAFLAAHAVNAGAKLDLENATEELKALMLQSGCPNKCKVAVNNIVKLARGESSRAGTDMKGLIKKYRKAEKWLAEFATRSCFNVFRVPRKEVVVPAELRP